MKHTRRCIAFFFLAALLLPSPAYAYLDPGTGNVLIYVGISLATALLYFVKSLIYGVQKRFSHAQTPEYAMGNEELVIFSEGKIYWSTFKPIVTALLAKKYPFKYLSMDIHDPGLAIESPFMNARYIGTGSAAFARAAGVRAKVMLQTTANIGTPGYPMPLPGYVRNLAHVLHGVGGIGLYYKNAHDTCNTLLLMGPEDWDSIRLLEQKRGLPARECVAAGVPCLDELARQVKPKQERSNPAVILIAPSWGEKNCLVYCGTRFVHWLAQAGYEVIIRPHPFSLKVEREMVESLETQFSEYANVCFDFNVDGSRSLGRADLMISDKSGVRLDFAFLYERPVMTFDVPLQNQEHFEISELDYVWENDVETQLGPVLKAEDVALLKPEAFLERIERALDAKNLQMAELRNRYVANFGCSGEFIADWAIAKCLELADAPRDVRIRAASAAQSHENKIP